LHVRHPLTFRTLLTSTTRSAVDMCPGPGAGRRLSTGQPRRRHRRPGAWPPDARRARRRRAGQSGRRPGTRCPHSPGTSTRPWPAPSRPAATAATCAWAACPTRRARTRAAPPDPGPNPKPDLARAGRPVQPHAPAPVLPCRPAARALRRVLACRVPAACWASLFGSCERRLQHRLTQCKACVVTCKHC